MTPTRNSYLAYGAAFVALAVALGIKQALSVVQADTATALLFTPAICVAAIMGGFVPASVVTAASAPFLAYYSSIDPTESIGLNLALFGAVGITIAWLGESFRQAQDRAVSASRQLQRREMYLHSILNSAPDATIGIRADGEIISFNTAAERQFGYRQAEVLGRNVKMLMPAPFSEEHDEHLRRYLRTGERRMIGSGRVVTGLRSNGTTFPMRLSVGEMVSGDEVIFTGFVHDLTASQKTAAELHEAHIELARLARVNELGEMTSMLAHELNQPLAAVANYLHGIRKMIAAPHPNTTAIAQAAEEGAAQSLRAGEIIRHLREFMVRGESERQIVDLGWLVDEAAGFALTGTQQSGIKLHKNHEAAGVQVLVNRVQLQQVVLNLLRNAVEAMRGQERRELLIETALTDAETAEIRVSDTGPGIHPQIRRELFKPFVSSKPGGMGIGLSISKRIVENHDGTMTAEPNPGGGTIFRLTLPIVSKGG